jgi:hypothetical protein
MKLLIGLIVSISMAACKKCEHAAQYVVPMYLQISPVPKVRLGIDTIAVTATVPYNTADLRLPGYPVSLKQFKPSDLYFSLSARPYVGDPPNPPIIPYIDGYFDLQPVLGMQKSKNLLFEFAKSDTAWIVQFKLVPKRKFEGLYTLRGSQIQYKDACMQIDPITIFFNTPQSHYLIQERLNLNLSPWQNDVFFYVE